MALQPETTHSLRPITDDDLEFLFSVYAATRAEERALFGWGDAQWEAFLRMQFNLQHSQYRSNYPGASFDIILIDNTPAGRLYVQRGENGMRIVDIALLPEFRSKGVGGRIMKGLIREADDKGLVMSLHVETNNPVREYYRTLGFREKEPRGIYHYLERCPRSPRPCIN